MKGNIRIKVAWERIAGLCIGYRVGREVVLIEAFTAVT